MRAALAADHAENALCLGGRVIGAEPAMECARALLAAHLSREARYGRTGQRLRRGT